MACSLQSWNDCILWLYFTCSHLASAALRCMPTITHYLLPHPFKRPIAHFISSAQSHTYPTSERHLPGRYCNLVKKCPC